MTYDPRTYWDERYKGTRKAGTGSLGDLYRFKLRIVQQMVSRYNVQSVIDYGCGDGAQLHELRVSRYLGLDISQKGIENAMRFQGPHREYRMVPEDYDGADAAAEMTVSLDVIQHLPDGAYEQYMRTLFRMSARLVLIYAPNQEGEGMDLHPHMFFRRFTDWIKDNTGAHCLRYIANEFPATVPAEHVSFSNFYLYEV